MVKILLVENNIHRKNLNFLLKCKNISFFYTESIDNIYNGNINLNDYDVIFSPCKLIDISKFPKNKFIFGPHCSIFPNTININLIKGKNSLYIQPSNWAKECWESFGNITQGLKILPFAFGVDTEVFKPNNSIIEKNNVIIYFKRRKPEELNFLINFLNNKKISFRIFSYTQHYDESDYLNYLQNSKYGIWLDAHESQGFALEEALSCNVPLLVWNVRSMNQEYESGYENIPATTIPYWDNRCGEYFYEQNDLENMFNYFISKLKDYRPREFIVENLSIDNCEKKLIQLINGFNI